MKNNLIAWLIAGFLTAYLSMTVEANMLRKEMPDEKKYWEINFGQQYFTNPILYAVIAAVIFYTVINYFPKGLREYYVVGAIMGIIIPSIKMINNYAVSVYDVTVPFLFTWDLMVYTLFYIIIIGPVMEYL